MVDCWGAGAKAAAVPMVARKAMESFMVVMLLAMIGLKDNEPEVMAVMKR